MSPAPTTSMPPRLEGYWVIALSLAAQAWPPSNEAPRPVTRPDAWIVMFDILSVRHAGVWLARPHTRWGRLERVFLSLAAEVAARIFEQICPDIWIGISAQNDGAGLTAGGPTDNISFRRIARHDCYARRRVRVSLLDIRALPVHLPSIGR